MAITEHLKALSTSIYFPAFLKATGQNALLVLAPLYILHLGYSPEVAALILACRGAGTLISDLPSGKFIARFGDRAGMLTGTTIMIIAYLLLGLMSQLWLIATCCFAVGFGSSISLIARQSYLTERCKAEERGRIIALLGGMMRAGSFAGPLAGGFIAAICGYTSVFYLLALLSFVALLFIYSQVEHNSVAHSEAPADTISLLKEHKKVFLTAGVCMISLQLMRTSKTVLVPLIGAGLGLEVEIIGTLVAAGAVMDLVMFYPAGMVMDQWGRKNAAIPAFCLYAIALCTLGFMTTQSMLLVASLILGTANGLSSGMILTLGSDYAPPNNRRPFIGLWRLVTDLGGTFAPVGISLTIKLWSLTFAGVLSGMTGVAAAALMLLAVREPLKRHSENEAP